MKKLVFLTGAGISAKTDEAKQQAIDNLGALVEKAKASQQTYIKAMDAAHKTIDFVNNNMAEALNEATL